MTRKLIWKPAGTIAVSIRHRAQRAGAQDCGTIIKPSSGRRAHSVIPRGKWGLMKPALIPIDIFAAICVSAAIIGGLLIASLCPDM